MKDDSVHKRVAVLAYHKIGGPPADGWDTWHYIPQATFAEQLRFVHDSDWSVIDLSTFLVGLENPESMPDRGLLLTFDDGYASMRSVAYPVLRTFGLPAVCFVPTTHVGACSTFGGGAEPVEPMCDWDDLRELDRNGVAIQSHGVSHNWFSLLNHEEQWEELVQSKGVLEERVGKPIEAFAFPFSDSGRNSDATRGLLLRAGYRAAFLCGGGPKTNGLPIQDPFRISRLAMYRDTDLETALA
jgi:peptidoglycan/xylan/chitin deacetylase (PgdA/CDA1 family)